MTMAERFILPGLADVDAKPFWDAAAAHELHIQTCARCGRRRMPPRPMCPWCRSLDATWPAVSGRGTVWSFVVAHPPLLPAYAEHAPYNVVVVALDDDPSVRLVGNLLAAADAPPDSIDPATICIGEPVRVVFTAVDDVVLPNWVRA
jgi:uncharacterized OB-fold protein